jgi:hypothetical protein
MAVKSESYVWHDLVSNDQAHTEIWILCVPWTCSADRFCGWCWCWFVMRKKTLLNGWLILADKRKRTGLRLAGVGHNQVTSTRDQGGHGWHTRNEAPSRDTYKQRRCFIHRRWYVCTPSFIRNNRCYCFDEGQKGLAMRSCSGISPKGNSGVTVNQRRFLFLTQSQFPNKLIPKIRAGQTTLSDNIYDIQRKVNIL